MLNNDIVKREPTRKKLRYNSNFEDEKCKIFAIYALSSGKFQDVRKYACVKDLTNIMSAHVAPIVQLCCTVLHYFA